MPINIKVQVGQIWSHPNIAHTYQITSISDRMVYFGGSGGSEIFFGELKEDGTPRNWAPEWRILTPEEQAQAEDQQRRVEYADKYL